jgi:hypothetical protein
MAAHRLMQLVPSSTRATDLRVRPCAPDVGGEEITWPSVMLVDLDPHPAPTPLNSTVSISETRLSYLTRKRMAEAGHDWGFHFIYPKCPQACPARCLKPGARAFARAVAYQPG